MPGGKFTARTLDPSDTGIGTYLGWFGSDGTPLEADHGGAGGKLSMIMGIVPAGGMLTFAVTGFDDEDFTGNHLVAGSYELQIELKSINLTGDYNGNGIVDAADYVIWRDTLNRTGSDLSADGDGNNRVDNEDYNLWKSHFGKSADGDAMANGTIAEPVTALLLLTATLLLVGRRQVARCEMLKRSRCFLLPLKKPLTNRGNL